MRTNYNLFSYCSTYSESQLILLAVPWSATASFGSGQEYGPQMIALSSSQMDFFSADKKDIRDKGICFLQAPDFLISLNTKTKKQALALIELEEKAPGNFSQSILQEINLSCRKMVDWVYQETKTIHTANKKFALIGGDHSTSEGAIKYFSQIYPQDLGILHIDAHADLRKTYQGLSHSHASVMYNIMYSTDTPPPISLVQVGVRDYCKSEYLLIKQNKNIHTFFDSKIKTALFEGQNWKSIVDSIIKCLPKKVYISLDVDGLQTHLFPNTGTPVPGGLSFEQTIYLLDCIVKSNRKIIGFDLVEIANPKKQNILWDAQVGARLLYQLCHTLLNNNN